MAGKDYASALDHNSRSRAAGRSQKQLSHVRIEPMENGGHVVEHHFTSNHELAYHEPEKYSFGKSEHKQMMAHLEKHLNLKASEPAKSAHEQETEQGAGDGD